MSSNSNISKKRFIMRNPDGTFSHLYRHGETDSICNQKEKQDENLLRNQRLLDSLTVSDDELQFLLDHADDFDFNTLFNQIVSVFRTYRFVFLVCLVVEMILMSLIMFKTFINKEDIITNMVNMYKDLSAIEASIFFNCAFVLFMLGNTIYYPVGYYAISNKKIKLLRFFANFSIYSAVATIFLVYMNVYFIFVFVLRLILFGFAKFIVNLLVSIILLPTRHSGAAATVTNINTQANNGLNVDFNIIVREDAGYGTLEL